MNAHRGPWLPRVASVAALVILASFVLAGWSFWNGHRQACRSRDASLFVLHDILKLARQSADPNRLTPEEQARAARFYKTAFARIERARC